jgi:hypothetical protein
VRPKSGAGVLEKELSDAGGLIQGGEAIFDLSRFKGASLAMIDRHYGHLARDGREHAVALLDALATGETAWTRG